MAPINGRISSRTRPIFYTKDRLWSFSVPINLNCASLPMNSGNSPYLKIEYSVFPLTVVSSWTNYLQAKKAWDSFRSSTFSILL